MEEFKNSEELKNSEESIFSETTSPLAERVHAAAVEKRKRRIKAHRILRAVIQLFFFILMPSAFYMGFAGVKNIAEWIGQGAVISFNSNVKILLMLCIFTIIFGRFFCGYLCAFGSLGDLVYALVSLFPRKILKRSKGYSIAPKTRKVLQLIKYLNLAVIVLMAVFAVTPRGASCFDAFMNLVNLKSAGGVIGVLSLVLVLVLMGLQERAFCQFLCPLGALFALLPILPFGTLHRREDNCPAGCRDCLNACPAALLLQENGDRGGECYGCENCISACSKNNISHTEDFVFRNDVIPVLVKTVIFLVLGVLLGICRFM